MAFEIPEAALPLVLGTALALSALTVVLTPLLADGEVDERKGSDPKPTANRRVAAEPEANSAVAALREIEFDRETGKLSDNDYADLKQRYTRAALDEFRAADAAALIAEEAAAAPHAAVALVTAETLVFDPVEAAIRRAQANQRSCGVCGPRPEPDATYCSSCGRYLPGACASCGTSIDLVGSRFCSGCGDELAAA